MSLVPRPPRTARLALCMVLAAMLLATGCGLGNLNSYPLPFTAGGGYEVTVELGNAVNLVPNAEVKVDNVTVGSVRRIEFEGWHAVITVSLNEGVRLPANAIARLGQKSLLGARYLALAPPAKEPPRGRLSDGDVIPLSRAGRFPETEEVLSALSLVLNGGGLTQVKTITEELNKVLGGREADVRSLLNRLDTFVGAIDAQRADLIRAIENFDRLAAALAEQKQVLGQAIETIPVGLRVLEAERDDLVRALQAVSRFGDVATRVVNSSRDNLVSDLRHLAPALREIADAGRALPQSLGLLAFPFPSTGSRIAAAGDYINAYGTLDFTLPTLRKFYLRGTPLESAVAGPLAPPLSGPAAEATKPLRPPTDLLDPLLGGDR